VHVIEDDSGTTPFYFKKGNPHASVENIHASVTITTVFMLLRITVIRLNCTNRIDLGISFEAQGYVTH
jgi:hypothetical protein